MRRTTLIIGVIRHRSAFLVTLTQVQSFITITGSIIQITEFVSQGSTSSKNQPFQCFFLILLFNNEYTRLFFCNLLSTFCPMDQWFIYVSPSLCLRTFYLRDWVFTVPGFPTERRVYLSLYGPLFSVSPNLHVQSPSRTSLHPQISIKSQHQILINVLYWRTQRSIGRRHPSSSFHRIVSFSRKKTINWQILEVVVPLLVSPQVWWKGSSIELSERPSYTFSSVNLLRVLLTSLNLT